LRVALMGRDGLALVRGSIYIHVVPAGTDVTYHRRVNDPRPVLITGGAGFIGSALARRLAARDARVRVIDDLSIGSRLYLDGVPVELIEGSLADPATVERALEGVGAVVHLAARAGIVDSVADPMATYRANVEQTVNLLETARRASVERFVFASSNAVIGEAEPPFDENMLAHPLSPYGASKLAGEAYCQAYAASFGMGATALRFSNVYGPRSLHKKSVVAAWLRAIFAGQRVVIHGSGEQTRDFIYVDDLADGIVAALDAPISAVAGEIFQIGTGRETSVMTLSSATIGASGRGADMEFGPSREGEALRNVSRVDKSAEGLGFRARMPLGDGLRATALWFEAALADPQLAAIQPRAISGSD
jgi:UDP-glucose 4-epimerase